jgi:hypothetical protein
VAAGAEYVVALKELARSQFNELVTELAYPSLGVIGVAGDRVAAGCCREVGEREVRALESVCQVEPLQVSKALPVHRIIPAVVLLQSALETPS